MGERDAAGGHGAVGGAAHERVGLALEGLVQGAAAAGDDGDAEEGLQQAGVEGADAALQAAEIEAGSGGDDDHGGDANFEERGVVGEQRVGLRGCEDVIGCRGGRHSSKDIAFGATVRGSPFGRIRLAGSLFG